MSLLALVGQISGVATAVQSVTDAFRGKPITGAAAQSTQAPSPTAFQDQLGKAVARMIQEKDRDGDGKLSVQEFGGSKDAFARLDLNGDGKLDGNELKQMLAQQPNAGGSTPFSASV
jgi:uncharacterized protein (DUF2141 family)